MSIFGDRKEMKTDICTAIHWLSLSLEKQAYEFYATQSMANKDTEKSAFDAIVSAYRDAFQKLSIPVDTFGECDGDNDCPQWWRCCADGICRPACLGKVGSREDQGCG